MDEHYKLVFTTGVYALLVVAALPIVFLVLRGAGGERFAFLALCWLPIGGLLAAIGLHHHLGYSVLILLGATLAASACLAVLGGRLCTKARMEKMPVAGLWIGTLVAGLPLLLFAVWAVFAQ